MYSHLFQSIPIYFLLIKIHYHQWIWYLPSLEKTGRSSRTSRRIPKVQMASHRRHGTCGTSLVPKIGGVSSPEMITWRGVYGCFGQHGYTSLFYLTSLGLCCFLQLRICCSMLRNIPTAANLVENDNQWRVVMTGQVGPSKIATMGF